MRVVSVRRCVCSAEDHEGSAGKMFLWRGSGRAAAPRKKCICSKTLFETRTGGWKRDRRDGHRLDDGPCLDNVHNANISGSSGLGANNACADVPFVFAHQRNDGRSAVCVLVKHVCCGGPCLLQSCVHLAVLMECLCVCGRVWRFRILLLLRCGLQKRAEITLFLGFLAWRLLRVVAPLLLFKLLQLCVLVLPTSAGDVQVVFEFVDDGLCVRSGCMLCVKGGGVRCVLAKWCPRTPASPQPLQPCPQALPSSVHGAGSSR